jgi:6-pyruvoyltetrahydropterin/6-carboxytetrahydropterin synthase
MYELEKHFSFEAGHVLKYHDGKCCHPHGHSYKLIIKLRGNELQNDGPHRNMLLDFGHISLVVKPMIEKYLDHKSINDTLKTDSPTAEFMAKWVYDYLEPHFPQLYSVTIQETATSKATYSQTI